MKIIFCSLFVIFMFINLKCIAQNVSGTITDTINKKNIANAVVAVLTPVDSILFKFIRTDKDGKFQLDNIKPGNYILMVTHPYFADFVDDISISDKGYTVNELPLIPKSKLLQEVIIKTGSPIKIKGDTISYTADSFKVSANANVEELLKKLPGIQVDKKGQIKAMGEKVEKVLVDGEEFFGDDPGMAVKNLRADAVKEVQVYDKKSEQAEFTGIDDGKTQKTINLKLKDDRKKGYFGKAEVAGGLLKKIDNRYNSNLLFNAFKGKRKIAGYLLNGNTGQAGLNWQDQQKFGGDDENVMMGMDEDGGGFMMITRGGSDEDPYIDTRNGFFENMSAGLQYSNKWDNKHTLNYSPKFNRQQYNNYKQTLAQTQLSPNVIFNENSTENISAYKRNVKNNLSFESKIDSSNTIKITTKLNFYNNSSKVSRLSENRDKDGLINNSSQSVTDNTNDKTSFSSSLLFKHKFKKDRRTFSVNTDFNLLDTKSTVFLKAINNLAKINQTDSIDQKKNSTNINKKLLGRAVYTEPLSKKYSLELNYELSWLGGNNDLSTLSKTFASSSKYDLPVDSLSNHFKQSIVTNKAGFKISFKDKKIKYGFGTGVGFTKFDLKDITFDTTYKRNFTNFFPAANFQYTYKANHSFNLNYNGRTIQPKLDQLQQLRNNSNTLSQYIGNPLLKQSFTHEIQVNHNTYNFLKEMWTYQSLNVNFTENAITNSVKINSLTGETLSQPVNTNGNISVNSWVGTGKKLKKLDLQLFTSVQYNYSKFIDLINGQQNKNSNSNTMFSINFSKSKEKKYEFNVQNDFGLNANESSIYNRKIKYNTYSLGLNGTIYLKKVWKFSSDFEFNYRQKTKDFPNNVNNNLWNIQVERTFHNDEFTIFGTVKDILNKNIGLDRNFYGNTFSEVRNDRLQRFWMIGFRWDFKNKTAAPSK